MPPKEKKPQYKCRACDDKAWFEKVLRIADDETATWILTFTKLCTRHATKLDESNTKRLAEMSAA